MTPLTTSLFRATLSKLKSCADDVVRHGVDSLTKALYEGSLRVQEAAATAIASLSYSKVCTHYDLVYVSPI